MTDKELLERAEKLQEEAATIIEKLDVLEILGRISEPEIVGSTKNGLMVLPDIDIHAYMQEVDLPKVAQLLPVFAIMPTIQKVQFNNYRELRRDHRKDRINFPHGYYVGLRSIQPSGEWKIDMWFGEKGTIGDFDEAELEQLTDEQRLVILRLKETLKTEKGYRDGIISTDFYKAVLYHGVKDPGDFFQYLEKRKKSSSP
jgi:hypothetical protein